MSELGLEEFRVWREIGRTPLGPVLEAAPTSEPGARVTVWPGQPPDVPAAVHPLVAMPLGHGEIDGSPVWVEDRPPGALLSDLEGPLPLSSAAMLLAQVADGLGALHALGHAHGQVGMDRVVVALDSVPVLIGAGVMAGETAADLQALIAMFKVLCPASAVPPHGSAAELAAGLRETAMSVEPPESSLREMVELAMIAPPAVPRILRISVTPMGYLDEVQPDLGPDEHVRGLLDRWSGTGSNEEFTDDRTEAISASELAAQARRVMLERLGDLYRRPVLDQRFAEQEGTPCEPLKALIADEPLDPLPVADGVIRQYETVQDQENTAEVTMEAPAPTLPQAPETPGTGEVTGWTGGETTSPQEQANRGLLYGLLAALAILAALATVVAVLISDGP